MWGPRPASSLRPTERTATSGASVSSPRSLSRPQAAFAKASRARAPRPSEIPTGPRSTPRPLLGSRRTARWRPFAPGAPARALRNAAAGSVPRTAAATRPSRSALSRAGAPSSFLTPAERPKGPSGSLSRRALQPIPTGHSAEGLEEPTTESGINGPPSVSWEQRVHKSGGHEDDEEGEHRGLAVRPARALGPLPLSPPQRDRLPREQPAHPLPEQHAIGHLVERRLRARREHEEKPEREEPEQIQPEVQRPKPAQRDRHEALERVARLAVEP